MNLLLQLAKDEPDDVRKVLDLWRGNGQITGFSPSQVNSLMQDASRDESSISMMESIMQV